MRTGDDSTYIQLQCGDLGDLDGEMEVTVEGDYGQVYVNVRKIMAHIDGKMIDVTSLVSEETVATLISEYIINGE